MSNALPTVGSEEVVVINRRPKAGVYHARLLQAVGQVSKKGGNPMVVVTWNIMSGDNEGDETKQYIMCVGYKGKKDPSKYWYMGVSEMKKAFASIGKPIPDEYRFAAMKSTDSYPEDVRKKIADANASLFAKRFNGVDVDIALTNDAQATNAEGENIYEDDGTPVYNTRTTVRGLHRKAVASAPYSPASEETPDEDDD